MRRTGLMLATMACLMWVATATAQETTGAYTTWHPGKNPRHAIS